MKEDDGGGIEFHTILTVIKIENVKNTHNREHVK